MYRKRHRKGKLKTTPPVLQEELDSIEDKKSEVAKKELEMLSFDWVDWDYPNLMNLPHHPTTKVQEDCIKTTVNSLTEGCSLGKIERKIKEKK